MREINNSNNIITRTGSLPTHIIEETANGRTPVDIRTLSLEKKILIISDEIDDKLAQEMILILHICASRGMSLVIYINSPGGSVSAGLAIQDTLEAYPYEYDIICVGLAASMAAVLLAGGRKGHRYIMPHSKVMIHEPLIAGGLGGSATSIQRTAESIMDTKRILSEMLSRFTGRSKEEIDKNTSFDNFFTAEQAIEFGLCDKIATGFERYTDA